MKVSFDGLRSNIAQAYNDHARTINKLEDVDKWEFNELKTTCDELRALIGILMCVEDDEDPNDCNDMSDIKLISTLPEEVEAGK